MNTKHNRIANNRKNFIWHIAFFFILSLAQTDTFAQSKVPLRRPISPSSPMWSIHIDTWINADPQKCIDLIPPDIRPYVVFNISLSVSSFVKDKYPFTIAESWLRTCAENKVWATIQPSSGYPNNFSNTDISTYEYFYRKYPNFIGWNFCEQSWGFDKAEQWLERLKLFTNLIKLGNKYGGYLIVSSTQTMNTPINNAVAMLKLDADFAIECKKSKENYIFLEKYTTSRGFYDLESVSLGNYLSGYCGNYGIRFDECGWSYYTPRETTAFPEASGIIPIIEHALLTGQTVIDGPELTWKQTLYQANNQVSADGFTSKSFRVFPQFTNISNDIFRKILDKTIRIPSKEEVIARTKIAIVNDVNTGTDRDKYSTPKSLFTGLYAMDGEWDTNNTWLKKSGRYPAIPTVFKAGTYETSGFTTIVAKSSYATRWPTTQAKLNEFNNLFPAEYSGDMYASRVNNTWVTYNPYLEADIVTKATIPFKYNTCDSINLTYAQYTTGIIKEYGNKIQLYLNNYRTDTTILRTNIIKIYGGINMPTYTLTDRDNHTQSIATANWAGGIFTLTILQNGPLDLTIDCSGSATNRLTDTLTTTIFEPAAPSEYIGDRQYEAENFEYKNISSGDSKILPFYTAMGYLSFGTNATASIKQKINVLKTGNYQLITRYAASGGDINTIDLYVNGTKVTTPSFTKTTTDSSWAVNIQTISLKAGVNTIMFSANKSGTNNINFDNIIISSSKKTIYNFTNDMATTSANNPPAETTTLQYGSGGVISYTNSNNIISNSFKAYSSGFINKTGVVDLNLFAQAADYTISWKEYYETTGGKKGMLLRANGNSAFATGMKQGYLFLATNNDDKTVTLQPYIVGPNGISAQQSYVSTFTIGSKTACWYRASALGNRLKFECSKDSITWEGGDIAIFIDNTYSGGYTQLAWGFGSDNYSWVIDDITYSSPNISLSQNSLQGFEYFQDAGPSANQSIIINGQSLNDNVTLIAPSGFEVSLAASSGYSNSIILTKMDDSIPQTTLFVRMKSGLFANTYIGNLSITTQGIPTISIPITGIVKQAKFYNFDTDIAKTIATIPPAANINVATSNNCTAGVASYTDAFINSNMLRAYSGGQRNATGVLNLNLFSSDATDYSVTWKQNIGSSGKDYKAGVLLRGNNTLGTSTEGYVEGLRQGYLFIAYSVGTAINPRTEFRIYKSTSLTTLTTLINNSVTTLSASPAQPIWYRASVSGATNTILKMEYSTDSITWNIGATITDPAATFKSGSTQLVWGLGSSNWDIYIDNITHVPVSSSSILNTSADSVLNLSYIKGFGPSESKLVNISVTSISDNIILLATDNFEMSFTETAGFSSSLTLTNNNKTIPSTNVFIRLKSGLTANEYNGAISFLNASGGILNKSIFVSGSVEQPLINVESIYNMNDFGYIFGGETAVKSFTVAGTLLSQNIQINAPQNFEISLNPQYGFNSIITIAPSNGTLQTTIIYLRLKSGLSIGNYNGTVVISSSGATSRSIDLVGNVLSQSIISISETVLSGFSYNYYANTSPTKTFIVSGSALINNITVTAPDNFEISLSPTKGFVNTLSLNKVYGTIAPTIIYVRLKLKLIENNYTGNITITSINAASRIISVNGTVSWSLMYDFTNDDATTLATPGSFPAQNMTTGLNNSATSGVVNYPNANTLTSNCFRAYTGGNRNGTGIVNLNLFPSNATDHSITWKQTLGSSASDYKVGVLLRGNGPVGTTNTGYVQGVMNGYVFIVYNVANLRTEFRIYRSTSSTSLTTLVNNTVASLIPISSQQVWYKATTIGASPVSLKLEYSLDSITWNNGAAFTDVATNSFKSGASQLLWGLASAGYNFYLDNITFRAGNSILPVKLSSFNVTALDNKAVLDWSTLSETNNATFSIEHGIDGKHFTAIGKVNGFGNSSANKHYTFIDNYPILGTNYYRLKQTDVNGTYTYSEIKQISILNKKQSITVFPNPTTNILYINSEKESGTVSIYNVSGKLVLKTYITKSTTSIINTSSLSAGVYYYRLNNEKGTITIFR